jgi:hypothetical protein
MYNIDVWNIWIVNEWNLHEISITKSGDVKFVMY